MTYDLSHDEKKQKRHLRVLLLFFLSVLMVAVLIVSARSVSAASFHPTATSAQQQPSPWLPTGKVWQLTVTFLDGNRQGQTEQSQMTFLPGGSLTAIFPGSSLLPAIDGTWWMTAPNAFHYRFRDPLYQGSLMVAYVQVQISAVLTTATSYVAGGTGVAYATATGLPIPGQYGVTSTVATAA